MVRNQAIKNTFIGRLCGVVMASGRPDSSGDGGGLPDERNDVDFVLVDQIVPIYNRVFICNLEENPTYHSVTPSGERARTGFVQWLET